MKRLRLLLNILNHPSNEYEDLKYKKNWDVLLSCIILAVWVIAEILQQQVTDFKFNTNNIQEFNVLYILGATLGLFVLWTLINWSVTTLLDGKGTLKEIWVSCAYALVPYIVTTFLYVIFSQLLTLDEASFLSVLRVIGILYSSFLVLTALRVVHSYSFKKTLACVFITLAGMVFVLFLLILFFGLIQQVILFFQTIYMELMFRS